MYVYIYIYRERESEREREREKEIRIFTLRALIDIPNTTTMCVSGFLYSRHRNTSEVVVRRALGSYFQQPLREQTPNSTSEVVFSSG